MKPQWSAISGIISSWIDIIDQRKAAADRRLRPQSRSVTSDAHTQPRPTCCRGSALSGQRILRPARWTPGALRDGAPSPSRGYVDDHCRAFVRSVAADGLSDGCKLQGGRLGGFTAKAARAEARSQAHPGDPGASGAPTTRATGLGCRGAALGSTTDFRSHHPSTQLGASAPRQKKTSPLLIGVGSLAKAADYERLRAQALSSPRAQYAAATLLRDGLAAWGSGAAPVAVIPSPVDVSTHNPLSAALASIVLRLTKGANACLIHV
jgi:hypothetical protein